MPVLSHPKALAPAPAPRTRDIVTSDLERVESYPMLSDSAIRAAALANNPEASAADVAAIIRRDSVLAAAVLRVANTWTYRGRTEVGDILQAVIRIGLRECATLVCAIGMRNLYKTHPPEVQKRCDALLRHSLFVAQVASGLNQITQFEFGGMEFTAGLLHDIGRLIATVKAPEAAAAADPLDFREDEETLSHERAVLGIDHCAIGYQFANQSSLPEPVVRVILNHHRPGEEKLHRELVALLSAADALANYVQDKHKIAGFNSAHHPAFAILMDGLTPELKSKFRSSFSETVVQALRDTRALLKAFASNE
ncbi:Putative domain HDIG-containing protein OS=Desulfosporosinus youngiae DSM 17734 GN=DesyoDRAFT_5299 PE=4 SV=1: HDOD [Gemmata massiliana]|uniref:HDOD domain-containing protein n=1 Tax=Gemmata massiliana TaxID=1210884 RepID=A0A6P2D2S0_9BACT|nr:HDOD domain-containing protein [Gemmata massiliana]VTR95591.1 Putative domain HDIG-containing protein OS=Desulfosporosinus youngiae DSM 17734 GN=DesyoDRAFT_5299 PE=4 SV=1: HDOD [Gemmata massiliana]